MRDAIAGLDAKPSCSTASRATSLRRTRWRARWRTAHACSPAAVLSTCPTTSWWSGSAAATRAADDRPETVRERLRVYHRETEPLVAYYRDRGLLRRVDGAQDADAVEAGIREALR